MIGGVTLGAKEEEIIKSETIYQLIVKGLQLAAKRDKFFSLLHRKRQLQKNYTARNSLETIRPD